MIKRIVLVLVLFLSKGFAQTPTPTPVLFVVNSTLDDDDAVLNGICDTAIDPNSITCTFRAAITEAHATDNSYIHFEIPLSDTNCIDGLCSITIGPTPLPAIFSGEKIDATTQPGSACGISWGNPPQQLKVKIITTSPDINGLTVSSTNVSIKGLWIFGDVLAPHSGEHAGIISTDTNITITCNRLENFDVGINIGGTIGVVNAQSSINLNVASGNKNEGIVIADSDHVAVSDNILGGDPNGIASNPNHGGGIALQGSSFITLVHNLIYSNDTGGGAGFYMRPSYNTTATPAVVTSSGDRIGVNRVGDPVGNTSPNGVGINAGTAIVLDGDLIAANQGNGVNIGAIIGDTGLTPSNVTIENSLIGTNQSGLSDLAYCNGAPQILDAGTGTVLSGNTITTADCALAIPIHCCGLSHCSVTTATFCTVDGDCPGGETCILQTNDFNANCIDNTFLSTTLGGTIEGTGGCSGVASAITGILTSDNFANCSVEGDPNSFCFTPGPTNTPAETPTVTPTETCGPGSDYPTPTPTPT